MNINYSSLFPDIIGAALDANLEPKYLGIGEAIKTAQTS